MKNIFTYVCNNRLSVILIFTCFSFRILAQPTDEIDRVLNAVRTNNVRLKSLQALLKSERLKLQSINNLPDPEFSGYYLPGGTHPEGDYSEYQISQSFEFPTLYASRKKWISQQQNQLQSQVHMAEKEVLLEAKKHCLHLVYIQKKIKLQEERISQSKEVYDLLQGLAENGDANKHELNQAKIGWIINQFNLESTIQQQRGVLQTLEQLNGGLPIAFAQEEYHKPLTILSFDSLWAEKMIMDPVLQNLENEKEVSLCGISVNRNQGLPDLTLGYNYQGVPGYDYSGIYGGVTIPLWNNRHKVKAAQAKHESMVLELDEKTKAYQTALQVKYSDFHFYRNKYLEYQNTLNGLSRDLLDSYKSNEITYVQYLMELYFYKEAFNAYLEIEHDLYRLSAELMSHRL